ncbi:MAG: hypothetical protein HY287_16865 [Planctomycetes bacterium]|nr:hypothetical protein [Planctomycetota bacterium]
MFRCSIPRRVGSIVCLLACAAIADPLNHTFTYQGQLKQNGAPINATHAMEFRLFDAATTPPGVQLGNAIQLSVAVENGLFTVTLNDTDQFGADPFDGNDRWLEVTVEGTTLSPRQKLTPTPYALQTRGIFVSDNGHVGIGPGPFVPDANLQVGIDPFTNGTFGGTNLQIGDTFAAQLILGRPGADLIQIITSTFGNSLNVIGVGGLELGTGPNLQGAFTRLFISPSGNVGIGTTTPTEHLSINGNVALTGSGLYEGINGSLGFLSDIGLGQGGVRLSSQSNIDVILDSDNNSTDSSFRIMVNNASRQVGGPVFLINERGNVAIGRSSTDPNSRVEIGGVTDSFAPTIPPNTEVVIQHLLNTAIPSGFTSTTADLKLQVTRDRSSPTFTRTQTTGFLTAEVNEDGSQLLHMFASSDNTDIAFETSAGEAMRVTATRRVGIGTSTPDNTLHVQKASAGTITGHVNAPLVVENSGNTYVNLLSPDANESGILFGKPTGGNVAGGIVYDNVATPDGLQFRTNGNATRMVIDSTGDVGIGTTSPSNRLTVSGSANFTGNVGIGVAAPDTPLDVARTSGTVGAFNRLSTDGVVVSIQKDGATQGTISVSGTTVSYNAFTGSHYGWSIGSIPPGMLVSMTGENRRFGDREGSEVVYGVMETVRANDPACLGACMGPEESNKAPGPENPLLVAAVGNGEMWVVDGGTGDFEPGDYLITSEVSGCAMKDDPTRFPVGHVIARAADRVHWADHAYGEHGQRRAQISVLFTSFERIGNPIAAQFQATVVTGFKQAMAAMTCEDSARILEKDRKIAALEARLERIEALMPHAEIRH